MNFYTVDEPRGLSGSSGTNKTSTTSDMIKSSSTLFTISAFLVLLSFFISKFYAHKIFLVKASSIAAWSSLWFSCSISMVIYNKWLLHEWSDGEFQFPITISLAHMFLKFVLSGLVIRYGDTTRRLFIRHCAKRCFPNSTWDSNEQIEDNGSTVTNQAPKITRSTWLYYAVPVGITTALDVAAGNASFIYVSVSFYTIVKNASLIFVFVFSILYRLQPATFPLFIVTSLIFSGVVMASYGEPKFNEIGFGLAFASAAIAGQRWALTEVLMLRIGTKMGSLMTIYTISPPAALTLVPFAIWLEGGKLVGSKFFTDPNYIGITLINIIGAGFFSFALIFVELALLNRTSSLTLSIIGYFKQVFQIIISVIIYHDPVTPLNVSGALITLFGMAIYTYIKSGPKEKSHHQQISGIDEDQRNGNHENGSSSSPPSFRARELSEMPRISNHTSSLLEFDDGSLQQKKTIFSTIQSWMESIRVPRFSTPYYSYSRSATTTNANQVLFTTDHLDEFVDIELQPNSHSQHAI